MCSRNKFNICYIKVVLSLSVCAFACAELRGAMAFALALQSVHDLPEGHGRTILSATISIVVLTVRYQTFSNSNISGI